MNEQIRELAEQAGLTFVNSITDDNEDIECVADTDGGLPCSTELEKFAELIVQECVQVCADRGTHHDGLYSAWADDCSKRIGKHFGVEE